MSNSKSTEELKPIVYSTFAKLRSKKDDPGAFEYYADELLQLLTQELNTRVREAQVDILSGVLSPGTPEWTHDNVQRRIKSLATNTEKEKDDA